eukprot:4395437-Pyramimonas_sp.AAC.1
MLRLVSDGSCSKPPIRARAQHRLRVGWHDWQDGAAGFQCSRCLRLGGNSRSQLDLTGCTGVPPLIDKLLKDPQGHLVVAAGLARNPASVDVVCAIPEKQSY